MAGAEAVAMSDRRALLTERERDIVSGEADVKDSYRYQTISRIRKRLQRLPDDREALEAHGELGAELLQQLGVTPRVDRTQLEDAARERWGDEFRVEEISWADGTTNAYAYHGQGRDEDGLKVRERMGIYDGEIGVVRQRLDPNPVVDEETVVGPETQDGQDK